MAAPTWNTASPPNERDPHCRPLRVAPCPHTQAFPALCECVGLHFALGRPGDKTMKHIPRKRFGQHFLSDQGIIDGIVQEIAPQPGDPMVEIGPGLAALTQPLVERLGRLTVIELDRQVVRHKDRLQDHHHEAVKRELQV